MADKIVLNESELRDALEDESTELLEKGSWRHGHSARYRIVRDGKSYAGWFRFHNDDGLQVFGDTEVHEVFPKETVVVVWEHQKP